MRLRARPTSGGDEVARRLQPAFEIDRGDQRFQRVGAQIDALAPAGRFTSLPAAISSGRPISSEIAASVSAFTMALSRSDSSPSLGFGKSRVEEIGDDQPEHAVAEEFHALVVGAGVLPRALAWVSARLQPLVVAKDVAGLP